MSAVSWLPWLNTDSFSEGGETSYFQVPGGSWPIRQCPIRQ